MVIMQSWIVVLYIIATKTKYRNGLNAALAVALIWFEIWGSLIRVKQFRFFQANFRENSIFSDNFKEKFRFFQANFQKNSIFQAKQAFTATSGQIILIFFKNHHFRTYFLFMIRYNNISLPVHDPLGRSRPSCSKSGGCATPKE